MIEWDMKRVDKAICKILRELKEAIRKKNIPTKDIVVVGILNGGKYLAYRIGMALGVEVLFIRAKRNGNEVVVDIEQGEKINEYTADKYIILADDVCETGKSMLEIVRLFLNLVFKKMVLVDKVSYEKVIEPDIVGEIYQGKEYIKFEWEKG